MVQGPGINAGVQVPFPMPQLNGLGNLPLLPAFLANIPQRPQPANGVVNVGKDPLALLPLKTRPRGPRLAESPRPQKRPSAPVSGPLGPGAAEPSLADLVGEPALPPLSAADSLPRLLEGLVQEKRPAGRTQSQPEPTQSVSFELLCGPPALPSSAAEVRTNLEGERTVRAGPLEPALVDRLRFPPPLPALPVFVADGR
jgi:hypothetical protein